MDVPRKFEAFHGTLVNFHGTLEFPRESPMGYSMFHDRGHVHVISMSKFHGVADGTCSSNFRGISVGFPWDFHGASMQLRDCQYIPQLIFGRLRRVFLTLTSNPCLPPGIALGQILGRCTLLRF